MIGSILDNDVGLAVEERYVFLPFSRRTTRAGFHCHLGFFVLSEIVIIFGVLFNVFIVLCALIVVFLLFVMRCQCWSPTFRFLYSFGPPLSVTVTVLRLLCGPPFVHFVVVFVCWWYGLQFLFDCLGIFICDRNI